jgi:hypothetical protein
MREISWLEISPLLPGEMKTSSFFAQTRDPIRMVRMAAARSFPSRDCRFIRKEEVESD